MAITTTSPTAAPPAPRWLRDLSTARTHYEERLGWPVTVDAGQHRLVLAAGQVLDAVTMPEPLGESVLAELQITMLTGPVIADPGGPRWTSDGQGSSRWVQPPRPHHRLPPWSVVIGTTRRVVNGHLGTTASPSP